MTSKSTDADADAHACAISEQPRYSIGEILQVDADFEENVCSLLNDVPLDEGSLDGQRMHRKKPLDILMFPTSPALSRQVSGEPAAPLTPRTTSDLVDSHFDVVPSSPSGHTTCAKLNYIESVDGLQGLKLALAKKFTAETGRVPDSFRQGYIVDMHGHWVSVHVILKNNNENSSLSLIVFDTLEVNYQQYHDIGLLRTSVPGTDDHKVDVATICKMLGVLYDIVFLAPISDMRRLTFREEEQIKTQKLANSEKSPTVYYDRHGNPFQRIIVQPVLQAERDGSCKSRSLAVLGWLLKLDEAALTWYVDSSRGVFHVELKKRIEKDGERFAETFDEETAGFGSLMATGWRDNFGRDTQMKVCHSNTLEYNKTIVGNRPVTLHDACYVGGESIEPLGFTNAEESKLRRSREAALNGIKGVLKTPVVLQDAVCDDNDEQRDTTRASHNLQQWREIEDHEARWQFLEETCFWWHNLGFKKIPKKFRREDVLLKHAPSIAESAITSNSDTSPGFSSTEYIRKYRHVQGQYITDETDPVFHKPLENFLGFVCNETQEQTETVPFSVLPFPGCFVALCLEHHVKGTDSFSLDLEGDPEQRRRQRVSDFSLPAGNSFLNDPISYNQLVSRGEQSKGDEDQTLATMLMRPSRMPEYQEAKLPDQQQPAKQTAAVGTCLPDKVSEESAQTKEVMAVAGKSAEPAQIFPIGSAVEAHSLSSAAINGMQGTVIGLQGERVRVEFPEGVKALKPQNLKIAVVAN